MNSTKYLLFFLLLSTACQTSIKDDGPGTYGHDVRFLSSHASLIELRDEAGLSKVLLAPEYQGRVMTSTATGDNGTSFGWINYDLISSGKKNSQFNPVGGEERFWLGPEGGQFSFYFHPGDSFNIKNWQVPAFLDTLPFNIRSFTTTEAVFSQRASLTNYSGIFFDIYVERKISLLNRGDIEKELQLSIPESVDAVAYRSENLVENKGVEEWKKESGLPSVWLLGMMTPSDQTVVIIPFSQQPQARELITTNYFGEIPADRLTILDSVLYFTCDGKYRSKLGIPPAIAKPVAGSYDFKNNVLTATSFVVAHGAAYVNSKWEIQKHPFQGDAVNAYNDGPLADGSQMGPFYELESSSPALALKSYQQSTYTQTTFHFVGDFTSLQIIAEKVLGFDLTEIKKQFR